MPPNQLRQCSSGVFFFRLKCGYKVFDDRGAVIVEHLARAEVFYILEVLGRRGRDNGTTCRNSELDRVTSHAGSVALDEYGLAGRRSSGLSREVKVEESILKEPCDGRFKGDSVGNFGDHIGLKDGVGLKGIFLAALRGYADGVAQDSGAVFEINVGPHGYDFTGDVLV